MFPSFDFLAHTADEDEKLVVRSLLPDITTLGRVMMLDFGDNNTATVKIADGKPVEAVTLKEKVQMYVQVLLRTALNKYRVYDDTNFGMSYFRYLGIRQLPKAFINSELQREITEKVQALEVVESVSDFKAEVNGTTLQVGFTITLMDNTSENITETVVI